MKNTKVALLVASLCAVMPAMAQNSLTLYGAYASGGSFDQERTSASGDNRRSSASLSSGFAGGASVEWPVDAARNWQVFFSGQRTSLPVTDVAPSSIDLSLYYLHFGGTNFFQGQAGNGPYVAGGLGATLMSPSGAGLGTETRPSFSLAVGYEHAFSPSLALRGELRGYATLINSNGEFFCSGGCVVSLRADSLVQAQALVGLSMRF